MSGSEKGLTDSRDHDLATGSPVLNERWEIDPEGDICCVYGTCDDGGDIVCLQPEGHDRSFIHWPRRARLISAAPDLLEALKELHLKTVVGTDAERHAALEKSWLAITKAEPQPTKGVENV